MNPECDHPKCVQSVTMYSWNVLGNDVINFPVSKMSWILQYRPGARCQYGYANSVPIKNVYKKCIWMHKYWKRLSGEKKIIDAGV